MKKGIIAVALTVVMSIVSAKAQNPIIQTKYTADPAPMVYHDTVFLYTSHDEDDAVGFKMRNWLLYTSTDMVNWTDHGIVASLLNFKWSDRAISGWGGSDNGAWAPQCIERNGKFYMYCPLQGRGIGVLVADSPYGPFSDPIGKALIDGSYDSIDPTVLIDNDGQAYLYWGNPNLWYVKLNPDMISFNGTPIKDTSFAKMKGQPDPFHYQEGPWAYKHNGHYYMAYASTCCPEGIGYAMSNSPFGPWVYKGMIMDGDGRSSGNHPGIIDYKGASYLFGFNYAISKQYMSKHYERRSVCLEKLNFNNDSTIQKLPFWSTAGVQQLGSLDPYKQNEAETMAFSEGVKTEFVIEGGGNSSWNKKQKNTGRLFVTSIHNGDYIKVQGADFSKGAASIDANIASLYGGKIEIHLDKIEGPIIGTISVKTSGEEDIWRVISTPVKNIRGTHDLFFVFKGVKDLFNFDWWKFNVQ